MNNTLQNLEKLAAVIEQERGELDLLALFQREGHDDRELVLAAPWATERKRDAIGYVGEKAAECLTGQEAAGVTSIVILNEAVATLASRFGGPGEFHDFTLNGVAVAHAMVVRLHSPRTRNDRRQTSSVTQ